MALFGTKPTTQTEPQQPAAQYAPEEVWPGGNEPGVPPPSVMGTEQDPERPPEGE